jgi:hypothetical protein
MPRAKRRYFVCLSNDGYAASIEPRKIYVSIADEEAEREGLLRVVDESGEDYLYPKARFARIEIPPSVERALRAAPPSRAGSGHPG